MLAAGKLFVPTLHDHGHGIGQHADDWDHAIYSVDRSFRTELIDGQSIKCVPMRASAAPAFSGAFPYSRVLDWTGLGVRHIKGRHPNGDIILDI